LVDLSLGAFPLQIDQFPDTWPPENVVAAASALFKSKPMEQAPEIFEADICVRFALENSKPEVLMATHQLNLSRASLRRKSDQLF